MEDLDREIAEKINENLPELFDKTSVSAVTSNDGVMRQVANIAHHGALIGYEDIYEAMTEIRKLTLPWWDQKECEKKQVKGKHGL